MIKNFNYNIFIPHLSALVIFIVLTQIYFYPIHSGKRLYQSDVANYKGLAHESEFYQLRTGKSALWTGSVFSGMPAFQISARYPANLFNYVYQTINTGLKTANLMLLAMICFYILLLALGVDPWLAITGAVAYSFSSYFFIILEVGHNSKTITLALLPAVVAGVLLTFKGKYLTGGVFTAFFLALNLIANHAQMTYYFFLMLGIFALLEFYRSLREKALVRYFKSAGTLLIAGLLAVSSSTTLLWMTNEYGAYSTRGKSELTLNNEVKTGGLDKDYATDWSYGISETFTLLIPNFAGNSSQSDVGQESELFKTLRSMGVSNAREIARNAPAYWGSQPFTEGPFYFGAVVCFLFVLGIFLVKGNIKWWLVTAVILSLLLSWGRNFMPLSELFLDYFPFYNKFRAVATILVIAMFAFPLLGFFGLNQFLTPYPDKAKSEKEGRKKALLYALGITGGITLFLILFSSALFDFSATGDKRLESAGWPMDALKADRQMLLKNDAIRSLFFILLTALTLWIYFHKRIGKQWVIVIIGLLVAVDLGWVGKRYLTADKFVPAGEIRLPYTPSMADRQILQYEIKQNPSIKNLADSLAVLFKNNAHEAIRESKKGQITPHEEEIALFAALNLKTNYRVMNLSVSTFNDASTSYFHKSIGGYHGAKMKRYQEMIEYHINRYNREVLDMLNTKYFIVSDSARGTYAQINPGALGNAWFVNEYKLVENADSEILAMNRFNAARTAIVDKRYSDYLRGISHNQADSAAIIKLTEYDLHNLKYFSESAKEELAVFSENYYDKGWNAYIDGNLTPHIRVNYILRGLRIPAGRHSIEFRFEPENYYRCEKISFAGSLLLLLLTAGVAAFKGREVFSIT
ncbi:MAG: hypothetical protein HYY40_07890 [Bacteroidetes bacterium]|nr:hypothetical protein [Bacteroidota bacterium]